MFKDNFSLIGYILKPHGKNGEINIRLKGFESENVEPGQTLFIEIDGFLVPFPVLEITPKGNAAVVLFEFISSPEEAEKLNGKNIFIDNSFFTQNSERIEFDPSAFTGFYFKDQNTGISGEVVEYIENPSNPLLLIRTSEKEFLVPFQQGIITKIDKLSKTIIANLPEGLTDL